MERYGLGVDLGGTKILAGVIELETGKIVSSAKKRTVPTPKDNSKDKDRDREPVKDHDLARRIGDVIDEAAVRDR